MIKINYTSKTRVALKSYNQTIAIFRFLSFCRLGKYSYKTKKQNTNEVTLSISP